MCKQPNKSEIYSVWSRLTKLTRKEKDELETGIKQKMNKNQQTCSQTSSKKVRIQLKNCNNPIPNFQGFWLKLCFEALNKIE